MDPYPKEKSKDQLEIIQRLILSYPRSTRDAEKITESRLDWWGSASHITLIIF